MIDPRQNGKQFCSAFKRYVPDGAFDPKELAHPCMESTTYNNSASDRDRVKISTLVNPEWPQNGSFGCVLW